VKKHQFGILTLAVLLLFSSCAATRETEPAAVIEYLQESKEVRAYIYETDASMKLVPDDAFMSLLDGSWEKKSDGADGEKILSIIAGSQYEICFFSDGTAMIYYGVVDILHRDRQYYTFTPGENPERMVQYIEENGTIYEETTD
jgi:hypothetical protein